MECSFCKTIFKNSSSLNNHIKTAKYCLSLRNKDVIFRCEYCNKNYSSKYGMDKHSINCHKIYTNIKSKIEEKYKIKLEKQQNMYESHIQTLQDKLENIAIKAVQRPTTSNKTHINNYIQNMKPVTDEHLIDNAQHLTIDHIKKGPEGYAEFALEYPLKDRVMCSDYSRRKVKFKDKDSNVITDPEMTTLAKKFFDSIKDKNKELICECANELKEKLGDDNVMDTVVKLFDYKSAIEQGSNGEKTEFHHDFVKQVCSKSIKE
jgi:hypothetical protein